MVLKATAKYGRPLDLMVWQGTALCLVQVNLVIPYTNYANRTHVGKVMSVRMFLKLFEEFRLNLVLGKCALKMCCILILVGLIQQIVTTLH
jgi:hypothetical protein